MRSSRIYIVSESVPRSAAVFIFLSLDHVTQRMHVETLFPKELHIGNVYFDISPSARKLFSFRWQLHILVIEGNLHFAKVRTVELIDLLYIRSYDPTAAINPIADQMSYFCDAMTLYPFSSQSRYINSLIKFFLCTIFDAYKLQYGFQSCSHPDRCTYNILFLSWFYLCAYICLSYLACITDIFVSGISLLYEKYQAASNLFVHVQLLFIIIINIIPYYS